MSIGFSVRDVSKSIWEIISSLVGAAVIIHFWGSRAGQGIIDRGRSPFWTSFRTLLAIWVSFFLGATLVSGIEHAWLHGYEGFVSAVVAWLAYGTFLFLIGGFLHGLLAGRWMGMEIKRRWAAQQSEQ